MAKGTGLILTILFLLFGLLMAYYGINSLRSNVSVWNKVQAKVTHIEASLSRDSLGTKKDDVTYTYEMGGKSYTKTTTTDTAEYHQGEVFTLLVDPADPNNTAFSAGENLLYGMIGLVVGLFCLVYAGIKLVKNVKENLVAASQGE